MVFTAGEASMMLRRSSRLTAVSMTLLAAVAAGWSARGNVLGITFDNSSLVDVNPATGAPSNPRATGITDPVGIAFSPGRTLYTVTAFRGGSTGNSLYTINPTTGASNRIGSTGLASVIEGDVAFSPSGILYGLESSSASGYQMFTVNTSTGAATIVGTLAIPNAEFSAMTFTPAGTLYVLENTSNSSNGAVGALLTVNPANGATLSSVPLSRTLGFTDGMYFDPSTGNLIVADGGSSANNDLFSLNP